MLKGPDIVVAAKLLSSSGQIAEAELAAQLGMSVALVNRAVRSAERSGLVTIVGPRGRGRAPNDKRVNRSALYEVLAFGVAYFLPVKPGRLVLGIPTAGSLPLIAGSFAADPNPMAWAHPEGDFRGMQVEPLHPGVPEACRKDSELYEVLGLVDAIRVGRARERALARELLKQRLL